LDQSDFFSCFNNHANCNHDKYLRGEGDSDSHLLTHLMVPYLLRDFFDQLRLKVQGKGFEPIITGMTMINRKGFTPIDKMLKQLSDNESLVKHHEKRSKTFVDKSN